MKGLEALKEIAIQTITAFDLKEPIRTNKINEMLETKQFKTIEKELKALEIIISKRVDVDGFLLSYDRETYNKLCHKYINVETQLTQGEYDLLKEVLLWKKD